MTIAYGVFVSVLLNSMSPGQPAPDQPVASDPRPGLDDLAWLTGRWEGEISNGWFEDYWSAPRAGMMMGMFRLVGPDDRTKVLEFEQIVETAEGVEFRFKHFSAEMEPWEEAKRPLTLRLERIDAESAVFLDPTPDQPKENHPHRLVLRRQGDDQYTSEVYVLRDGRETKILTSTARRVRDAEPMADASPTLRVTAGCGSCVFGMEDALGCPLAVKVKGRAYLVSGVEMDDLGDAHAADGLCNVAREADAAGHVDGDRFVAERIRLLPR